MIGTKIDQEVFESLPKDEEFTIEDFSIIKNTYHRFQRLIAQGLLTWRVKDGERVYKVCVSIETH